jgi:hypothetical protein
MGAIGNLATEDIGQRSLQRLAGLILVNQLQGPRKDFGFRRESPLHRVILPRIGF